MDGTENQKDTSGATQDSSGGKQETSEQTPKTFTEEEHTKAISDLSAEKGREIKTLTQRADNAEKAVIAAQETIKRFEAEQDEKERRAAEGDEDAYAAYQRKKQAREDKETIAQDRAALEKEKIDHQAEIQAARDTRKEVEIFEIAGKYGVDASVLKQKAERFKLETKEDIDEFAQTMSSAKPANLKVDSGKTIGGEDVSLLNADELLQKGFRDLKK